MVDERSKTDEIVVDSKGTRWRARQLFWGGRARNFGTIWLKSYQPILVHKISPQCRRSRAEYCPCGSSHVRCDFIGRGTYARVYFVLNAMTGDVMAVDQVELPTTVSNMENPRQISVVDAIRSESSARQIIQISCSTWYPGDWEVSYHLLGIRS